MNQNLNEQLFEYDDGKESLEMQIALEEDNKEEFLRLVKSPRLQKEKDWLWATIIGEEAVKCATAVLDGETNGIISINPDFRFGFAVGCQWTVMHYSAVYVSSKLLALFLERGFRADTRAHWKDLNLKHVLPLNVALRQIRHIFLTRFWDSQERSAARLLMELSIKDDLLEAVRLLALNTREFKHEFFKYAKEGKMVEVGALLLAAGEKLMPLCISQGEDVVFNSFKEIGHFLHAKNTWLAMSHDEFREMKETLLLLDMYDKIGDELTTYVRSEEKTPHQLVGVGVAHLLEAAGFDVNNEVLEFQGFSIRSKWRVPQNRAPREFVKFIWKQSQQPSIPTRHLFHTSLFGNIDSRYAPFTPAKKLVNGMQNLNACKRWVSFMTILRRGVRRV